MALRAKGKNSMDGDDVFGLKSRKRGRPLKKLFLILGASIISLVMAGLAGAATLDTTPAWDGSQYVYNFGPYDTATYGEVVTSPGGTLESFTFYMKQPTSRTFEGYVYAWDGSKATGPALWSSGAMHTTDPTIFEPITFNTGGVPTTGGTQYILFATISNHYPDSGDYGYWGYIGSNSPYPSTYFAFHNNGSDFSLLTTSAWDSIEYIHFGRDTALPFQAEFAHAPLPGAIWLLGSGLIGLAGLGRRKFIRR